MYRRIMQIISCFMCFVLIVLLFPNNIVSSANKEKLIATQEDFFDFVQLSQTNSYEGYIIKLTADIYLTENEINDACNQRELKSITIGNKDYPFKGEFDGQGHKVIGLTNYGNYAKNRPNSGMFFETEDAVIRNITLENVRLRANYQGGILVGLAKNSRIENIIIKNSSLNISTGDDVLELITTMGFSGGALAGEIVNSVVYNCTINCSGVECNTTQGVAALSGDGLYIGCLVGTVTDNSLIEYSRVTENSYAENKFDVAVGALGGKIVYAGGIAGQIQNASKMIDCFSTAYVYAYSATYVSVGAGNTSRCGGLSAAMYGSNCEILRCHYAGNIESRQYNAVLVVPIIQNNVNLAGLVQSFDGGTVKNSYFKLSTAKNGDSDKNVYSLNEDNGSPECGALYDKEYVNRNYWADRGYDFTGNIQRTSDYSSEHYNKWVMDYSIGIPVHGNSISATLDFDGAGDVTIGATSLVGNSCTTSSAYNPTTQGLLTGETTISLSTVPSSDSYRLNGWYRTSDYTLGYIKNYSFFETVFSSGEAESTEYNYTPSDCADNDLFIAKYECNVIFMDLSGNNQLYNGWHSYNEPLPDITEEDEPAGCTLLGWTTISKNGRGYAHITTIELERITLENELYKSGNKIKKALILFPIYSNYLSNISTVFEGHERDSSESVSLRQGVGYTTISEENEKAYIEVCAEDGTSNFPEGYRFIGWYESQDGVEIKVSSEKRFCLDTVDLSKTHLYTARFEYSVEYYVKKQYQSSLGDFYSDSTLYTTLWHRYGADFENIPGPEFMREHFEFWALESHSNTTPFTGKIYEPKKVYSHDSFNGSGSTTGYSAVVTCDFPNSGVLKSTNSSVNFTASIQPFDGYNFLFWSKERENGSSGEISRDQEYNYGVLSSANNYVFCARVTADVHFYKKTGEVETVTRRYNESVFLSSDSVYSYPYTCSSELTGETTTSLSSPSYESMFVDDYYFLGWVDKNEFSEAEWNNFYDVSEDACTVSQIERAQPYILDQTDVVVKTMSLYPVYVKYNIITNTNISLLNNSMVNQPQNPLFVIDHENRETGEAEIELSPDIDTYIYGDSGDKYILVDLLGVDNKGNAVVLEQNGNAFTGKVFPGIEYTFTAIYEPYVIVFHLNGNEEIKLLYKNNNEEVGETFIPSFNISDALFVGWTDATPTDAKRWLIDNYQELRQFNIVTEKTLVACSMDLYPTFCKIGIQVNSNIDNIMGGDAKNVRYYKTSNTTTGLTLHGDSYWNNYNLYGWYKNYNQENAQFLSDKTDYMLSIEEVFSEDNVIYTAVYKQCVLVNYYGTDGTILYRKEIIVEDNIPFVQAEIVNEEIQNVIVDPEPFNLIFATLAPNQAFNEWHRFDENGNIIPWQDFCMDPITTSMNLYPTLFEVSANSKVDGSGTDLISLINFDINHNEYGIDVDAYLKEAYNEPKLKATIKCLTFSPSQTLIEYIDGIEVSLYLCDNNLYQTKTTDANGDAIFNFDGKITIVKTGNIYENDIFIFDLISVTNSSDYQTVYVKFTTANNKVDIIVPYGNYSIFERNDWSWRYSTSVAEETAIINADNQNISITFNNELTNRKWLSVTTITSNHYQ